MNNLLYGKNSIDRIVSIEPEDNTTTIWQELAEGNVVKSSIPNKYWILSPCPIQGTWHRLKGDLHYKYGQQFTTREGFLEARREYRRFDTLSIYDNKESTMVKDGLTYYKGMNVQDVSILSFDIETTGLDPFAKDAKVLLITNTFRRNGIVSRKLFAYDDYKDQKEMIDKWCEFVREINPAVITGFNINIFDFSYLIGICKKVDTKLMLGRDNSPIKVAGFDSKLRKDGSQFYTYKKLHIYGREIVDMFFVSLKHDVGRKYESYKLKSIIAYEGLEKEERVFYDASQIRFKYQDKVEWEKIKQYCIDDGDDVLNLFDLMIPSFFYFTPHVSKCFQAITESASGSQINSMLMRAYLQEGHSLPKATSETQFVGGISYGNPGIYKNVMKIDVASLYPSLMLSYQINNLEKDPENYLIKMLDHFRTSRLEYKRLAKETGNLYYNQLDSSAKVFINSVYGFMGAKGLCFNYPEGAALITRKGRELLQQSIVWATGKSYEEWK